MRATVSAALPALTVLTATIERLGQLCASAAGARVARTTPAMTPRADRNDIATSLECRRSSDRLRPSRWRGPRWRPAVRLHGSMMLSTGPVRPAVARRTRAGGDSPGTHHLRVDREGPRGGAWMHWQQRGGNTIEPSTLSAPSMFVLLCES